MNNNVNKTQSQCILFQMKKRKKNNIHNHNIVIIMYSWWQPNTHTHTHTSTCDGWWKKKCDWCITGQMKLQYSLSHLSMLLNLNTLNPLCQICSHCIYKSRQCIHNASVVYLCVLPWSKTNSLKPETVTPSSFAAIQVFKFFIFNCFKILDWFSAVGCSDKKPWGI